VSHPADISFDDEDVAVADAPVVLHDPEYVQENLRIRIKKGGPPVSITYNFVQLDLERIVFRLLEEGRPIRFLILKARQMGVSTWVESLIYDWICRRPYVSALIVSHDSFGSEHLYKMFKTFYEFDPSPRPTDYSHQKGLVFAEPHGSQVMVQTAGTSYAGTSQTNQLVHLSELAKWPDPETTHLSIMQGVPDDPHTFAVMESTAAGAGDWWNQQWDSAVAAGPTSEWLPLFYPWFVHAEYQRQVDSVDMSHIGSHKRYNMTDGEETELLALTHAHVGDNQEFPVTVTMEQLAWRRATIDGKCGGEVLKFHQENPASPEQAFISSGKPKYPVALLQKMLKGCKEPIAQGTFATLEQRPKSKPDLIHVDPSEQIPDVKIWKMPVDGHRYGVTADCKGDSISGDFHAGSVIDFTVRPREHVATIHGEWDSDTFASLLVQIATLYNGGLLSIEINGVGLAVQMRANRLYHNFYHRLEVGKEQNFPTQRVGWQTLPHTTRPEIIETLGEHIREEEIVTWDRPLVMELLSFQTAPGQRLAEHKPGAKDDRVFSIGINLCTGNYTAIGQIRGYNKADHEQAGGDNMGNFR